MNIYTETNNNYFVNEPVFWTNESIYKPSNETFNIFLAKVKREQNIHNNININWLDYKKGLITLDFKATYLINNKGCFFLEPYKVKNKEKNIITYFVILDVWATFLINKTITGDLTLTSDKTLYIEHLNINSEKRILNNRSLYLEQFSNKIRTNKITILEPSLNNITKTYVNRTGINDFKKWGFNDYYYKNVFFNWNINKYDFTFKYSNVYSFKYKINNKAYNIQGIYNPQLMKSEIALDIEPLDINNLIIDYEQARSYEFTLNNIEELSLKWTTTNENVLELFNQSEQYKKAYNFYLTYDTTNGERYSVHQFTSGSLSNFTYNLFMKDNTGGIQVDRTYMKYIFEWFKYDTLPKSTGIFDYKDVGNKITDFFDNTKFKKQDNTFLFNSLLQNNCLIKINKKSDNYLLIWNMQVYYLYPTTEKQTTEISSFETNLDVESQIKNTGNFISIYSNNYNNQKEIIFKDGTTVKLENGFNNIYYKHLKIDESKQEYILYYIIESSKNKIFNWIRLTYQNLEYQNAIFKSELNNKVINYNKSINEFKLQEYQNKLNRTFAVASFINGTVSGISSNLLGGAIALGTGNPFGVYSAGANMVNNLTGSGANLANNLINNEIQSKKIQIEKNAFINSYQNDLMKFNALNTIQNNNSLDTNIISQIIKQLNLNDYPFIILSYTPSIIDNEILSLQQSKLGFNVSLPNQQITLSDPGIYMFNTFDNFSIEYSDEIAQILNNIIIIK